MNGAHAVLPAPEADDVWDGPAEPFEGQKLPTFPTAALPAVLRNWTHSLATACQVPVDLPATMALGVASFAACRAARVEVTADWSEPCNLYLVTAMAPGERKSAVIARARAPIDTYQRELIEILSPAVAKRADEREIIEGQIAKCKAAAIAGKLVEGIDARHRIGELRAELERLPAVTCPTLVADDATPEALAVTLRDSYERVAVVSSEGGPFEMMGGRYSDKGSNLELYLKTHTGEPHAVSRIKRESFALVQPLVAMALTVQPTVISGLAKKEGFRGLGLLARFAFSLPESFMGLREVTPDPFHADYGSAYDAAILAILRGEQRRVLTLSPAASLARVRYQTALESRLGPDGDLRPMADWCGKLVGLVARLAGIIHLLDHAPDRCPDAIGGECFERACGIGDYFVAHSTAALERMGLDDVTELASRLWATFVRRGMSGVDRRSAHRMVHRSTADQIQAALDLLVERRLLRPIGSAASRDTQVYAVRTLAS